MSINDCSHVNIRIFYLYFISSLLSITFQKNSISLPGFIARSSAIRKGYSCVRGSRIELEKRPYLDGGNILMISYMFIVADNFKGKMPYLDGGDVLRLISSVLIVADNCNNLRITFRKREFVKSIGLGSLGLAGAILCGLVGNFAYDQEKLGSAGMWPITSAVFRHPLCLKLIIIALVIWLGLNGFFVTFHDDRNAGRPALHSGRLDPQLARSPDPPITNDPNLLGLMDHVMNEIVMTRDEMRALDERLSLLQERVQNILPSAIVRSSPPDLSLTVHTKDPVPDLEAAMGSTVTVSGSKILHRRFEIESPTDFESENARLRAKLDNLRLQIITTMRLARNIDKDCTFQLGSFAVVKYTDAGFKWWKLQRRSVPEILDIRRSPWKLSNLLAGCPPTWTIRGYNLQNATLKAASANISETLKILRSQKMESGEDLFLCEEPLLLQDLIPMFKGQIYIYASTNIMEVEEGTTVRLQSEPINARKAYWISVLQGFVPSRWTMIIIGSLSLLTTLESTPFKKQDDLFPNVEHRLTLQLFGNIIFLGTNSSQNSNLVKLGMVLYNFFQVYIFAIFIPNLVSTLWLLSRDFIWPLGFHVAGVETLPTLEEAIRSGPRLTYIPYVEHFLDDITNNPNPTIVPPVMPLEEEGVALSNDVADSDNNFSTRVTPSALVECESNRKREIIGEPDKELISCPITPSEDKSNIPDPASPVPHEELTRMDMSTKEGKEGGFSHSGVEFKSRDQYGENQEEAMEETEKVTLGEEEGRLAENKQEEGNDIPNLQLCVPFEDLSERGNPASLLPQDESIKENSNNGEEQEQENEISPTQTDESSPCNSPARPSMPDSEFTDRRQDSPMSVRAFSSFSIDGSLKTRTVAIAVEAHSRYKIEPFMYAINNLAEQKVVVISCLSRLRDEMGVDHPIDLNSFSGVSEKKLAAEVKTQVINLNHFLRDVRDKLSQRGVQLDIWVAVGPKSHDILVQVAKKLHPLWLVLGRSFSRHKKDIQAALQCNLVLMRKNGPEILQLNPDDQIHDKGNYEEDPELSSRPRPISRSASSSSKASPITRLKSFLGFQNSTQETISSSTVIPGFTDGGSGADESDGPRKDQTVLYLGSRSAYLQREDRTLTQEVPILLSSRSIRASPTASPTQSSWLNFKSRLTTKRSNEKSIQLLHQEEVDSQTGFPSSSSGSRTPMAESKENIIFRMTPTGIIEYTSIGDSETVKKHGGHGLVPQEITPFGGLNPKLPLHQLDAWLKIDANIMKFKEEDEVDVNAASDAQQWSPNSTHNSYFSEDPSDSSIASMSSSFSEE